MHDPAAAHPVHMTPLRKPQVRTVSTAMHPRNICILRTDTVITLLHMPCILMSMQ